MSWFAVGSLAVGAIGVGMSYKGGKDAAKDSKISAGIEADQLEQRAKDTIVAGSFNADRIRQKADKIIASQNAMAAARGDDLNDSSVRAIREESLKEASIEQLLVMMDAENDAKKDREAAKVTRETGASTGRLMQNQANANLLSGTASLLSTASNIDWSEKFG